MGPRSVSHMVSRSRPRPPTLPAAASGTNTPASSQFPSTTISAYPSEDESTSNRKSSKSSKSFPFLSLPSELRDKVYDYLFITVPEILDLEYDNYRSVHKHILPVFLVNSQINNEASHRFYSRHTIRIFPTNGGRFFKTKKPLLARLSPRLRNSISTLELRIGPGFAAPPRGWVINDALGLSDCTNVRVLKVLVQLDPSEPMFKGYRHGEAYGEMHFYEKFCSDLLSGILDQIEGVREVQFDAYEGVRRHGSMMRYLLDTVEEFEEVEEKELIVSWGPLRRWKAEIDEEKKEDMVDSVLLQNLGDLSLLATPVHTIVSVFG